MRRPISTFWAITAVTALGLVAAACMESTPPEAPSAPEAASQDVNTSSMSSDLTNPLPNCAQIGHVFICSVNGAVFDRQCFCPNTSAAILKQAFIDGCTGCVEAGGTIADSGQGWPPEATCNVCNAFGNPPPTCQ
jgi:hypothetical protein